MSFLGHFLCLDFKDFILLFLSDYVFITDINITITTIYLFSAC